MSDQEGQVPEEEVKEGSQTESPVTTEEPVATEPEPATEPEAETTEEPKSAPEDPEPEELKPEEPEEPEEPAATEPEEPEPKPEEPEPKPEEPKPEEPVATEPEEPKPEEPVATEPEEPKPKEPVATEPEEPEPKEPDEPKPKEPVATEPEPEQPATTDSRQEEPAATDPEPDEPATESPEEPQTVPTEGAALQPTEKTEDKKESEVAEVKEKEEKDYVRKTLRSTQPNVGVDIAMGKSGIGKITPITVGQMLQKTCKYFHDQPALAYKENNDIWRMVSYADYYRNCCNAAKSFIKLGLKKYNAVGIIGFNSPEWFYSNLGAMFAGGLSAGIYTTNGPEACYYVAQDCKANVIVVEDQKQLDKILEIRDRLPELKAIIQYKGKLSKECENVYDWDQFIDLGKDVEDSVVEEIIASQSPEECALLIYTSGTTGNPKAVMLSHDNLTWTAQALYSVEASMINWRIGQPARIVTYLPLSHIAGQMADIYLPMYVAATVYFASPDALKGGLVKTINEVKPTLFFGVPRVWEKIMEGMKSAGANVTGIKKKIGTWATSKGFEGNVNLQNKRAVPWGWTIANTLVLSNIREKIGLDKTRLLHVGAAPVHRDVLEFFMRFNLPVLELYGMSENSGPTTLNTIHNWRLGSVGKVMRGTRIKIANPDKDGNGEICMYGRHVFMGYLNNEDKTKEAIDDEGWLHSGDIGRIDKEGFLFITGRIKELIITSGGENIAPVPIEDNIKAEVPFLSNVMLIGDQKKFLSCVVTLKCEMDPDTAEPIDELHPQIAKQIADFGCELTKPSEIAKQKVEVVMKAIQEGLDRANGKALSRAQKVQKFIMLETDFSMPGGELGPTLKLKRRVVIRKYGDIIDEMYEEVAKL